MNESPSSWATRLCQAYVVACSIATTQVASAEPAGNTRLDLRGAVVVAPAGRSGPAAKAVEVLVEEVERRTAVRWPVVRAWPDAETPVVAVGPAAALKAFAGPVAERLAADLATDGPEGYHIRIESQPRPVVLVVGNDARGVLFGVGRLLREMRMSRDAIALPSGLRVSAVPQCSLRGHQLGYRPKTNSYDAWDVPMWEQYIRDLAVFGNNAIELIPPRSDDDDDSPHFPLPKLRMMAEMSRIADDYGLDVWIWYPAMDKDYSDPDTVAFALKEWEAVFRALPRIDVVFVPGGDPGHTQPRVLMALLEKQANVLRRHHPDAQMWMSPQSFTAEWMAEFHTYMNEVQPKWLGGIVFGPQNRTSLPDLRAATPAQYPIRRYPDITHSIRCQYAVPNWDVAYAMTEHREVINPRPLDETRIFRLWNDQAVGFLTYSEGCNDDVNKIIWSGLGWNRDADPLETLRQYSRYFIGARWAEAFAQGLLALEENWRGPLLTNAGVDTTLKRFQEMEAAASPRLLLNWRFQQALYRAYYDAYNRRRLIYETELEASTMDILRRATETGAKRAVNRAEAVLARATTERVAADWRARIFELAEALYQSIHMQLSVPRYKAIHVGRGANLDLIDAPLNNRLWLERRFTEIRRLRDEAARLDAIAEIVHWTDPGPGGYYDDLGSLTNESHLVRGAGHQTDPEFRRTARTGFRLERDRRISWVRFAESRYEAPLRMRYTGLDRHAAYRVKVVYTGDHFETKVRLVADERFEVHAPMTKPQPLRPLIFDVPAEATADGELVLSWTSEAGHGGSGRGCQVAEVWLMKNAKR